MQGFYIEKSVFTGYGALPLCHISDLILDGSLRCSRWPALNSASLYILLISCSLFFVSLSLLSFQLYGWMLLLLVLLFWWCPPILLKSLLFYLYSLLCQCRLSCCYCDFLCVVKSVVFPHCHYLCVFLFHSGIICCLPAMVSYDALSHKRSNCNNPDILNNAAVFIFCYFIHFFF